MNGFEEKMEHNKQQELINLIVNVVCDQIIDTIPYHIENFHNNSHSINLVYLEEVKKEINEMKNSFEIIEKLREILDDYKV